MLQTDDVGIFQSTLSNEYLLASQHFGLTREDLCVLCEEGVKMIFASNDEKVNLRKRLDAVRRDLTIG